MTFLDFVNQSLNARFIWGINDCCLFPANAHLAVTGVDLMEDFRGYSSELEASSLLIQRFGTTDMSLVLEILARDRGYSKTNNPKDGDVTTLPMAVPSKRFPVGLSVGLVAGGQVWMPSRRGLTAVPLSMVNKDIWRIA